MIPVVLWTAAALAQEAPAEDPRFALTVEMGTLSTRGEGYDLFSSSDSMLGFGLEVGYRPQAHLELVAGWQRSSWGSTVEVRGVEDGGYDFQGGNQTLVAAFESHQMSVGARVDQDVAGVFWPYLTAQAVVIHGIGRLDDDPSRRTNPNQIRSAGWGVGALAMAGAEVRLLRDAGVQVGLHLEMGYGRTTPVQLGGLGRVEPGGFAMRVGAGFRF